LPKAKYYFNTHSLKYEKVVVSFKKRFLQVLGWLATAAVFSSVIIALAYKFLDSPKERQLKREISLMQFQYDLLQQRTERAERVLTQLQEHDDNIYRVIFEAEPIPSTVRQAGYGGVDKYKALEGYDNSELMVATTKKIDKLEKSLYVQSKSFDEVFELAKNKKVLLASIPAIQPVSNKDLTRIASGYGYRIHPIYKTRIMHTGIDFTAPVGTEIYSTGNGTVGRVEYDGRGYGNNVVINHGYGYMTLYAHMSKIAVKQGQKINRGDVIGYVGSTGSSTGPHCHYEVIRNNQKINPINYFYNDLTAEQYEKVIEIASKENQSFD
jgi:murein DD-endopeptidase MepM/ murein hydrolase activator NlpD